MLNSIVSSKLKNIWNEVIMISENEIENLSYEEVIQKITNTYTDALKNRNIFIERHIVEYIVRDNIQEE